MPGQESAQEGVGGVNSRTRNGMAHTYANRIDHKHDGCVDCPQPSGRGVLARYRRLLEQDTVPAHNGETHECLADRRGHIVENKFKETESQRYCGDIVLGTIATVVYSAARK